MKLLLTGGTGKVGQNFLRAFLRSDEHAGWQVRALCHNRRVEPSERVEVLSGSLAEPAVVEEAMRDVTHVLHLAAVKETPEMVIDVAVKGMFLLLEEARRSPTLKQFILVSGDCTVGHIFVPYDGPITERSPRRAYPGCYALTKVLEEVMLEQYQVQYGLKGTTLRAPWIMEKDDFKFALAFGPDQFGGPDWDTLVGAETAALYAGDNLVPVMLDSEGAPLRRNFVHVDDLVTAILASLDAAAAGGETFNISMDRPIDYAEVAAYLATRHGLSSVEIPTQFHSNWLDNAKARLRLDWRPSNDFEALVDRAWAYERPPDEPRKIWYPG